MSITTFQGRAEMSKSLKIENQILVKVYGDIYQHRRVKDQLVV